MDFFFLSTENSIVPEYLWLHFVLCKLASYLLDEGKNNLFPLSSLVLTISWYTQKYHLGLCRL